MMRKISLALAVALVLAAALPTLAGEMAKDTGKDVKMTGWISDECCALKNANAEGKGCTIACHKNGSALVFVSDGKVYKVSDQKKALQNVGFEVEVTGNLAEDGMLKIASIEASKKKA